MSGSARSVRSASLAEAVGNRLHRGIIQVSPAPALLRRITLMDGNKLAILVGGGPAPGINAVIGAATIRARLAGANVIGIKDGFERLMHGDISSAVPLTIEAVSRIHFRGGSFLGISRANPTTDPERLETTQASLERLNITQLITIGGDGTVSTAQKLLDHIGDRLQVVHVPKTIDDDLDLP